MKPDIAGFYITDDYIDVAYGFDPDANRKADANIRVKIGDEDWDGFREPFRKGDTSERAIRRTVDRLHTVIGPGPIRSICIGAYGPFASLSNGAGYGQVLRIGLPRLMRGENIYEEFKDAFERSGFKAAPSTIVVDTDAACAALGEAFRRYTKDGEWIGDGRSKVLAFIKVSHGLGGAICQASNPYHGRLHSEMGQIIVRKWQDAKRDPDDDEARFEGVGPYPGRLESLACVSAIEARFGASFRELAEKHGHAAWHRQAWYLAQACMAVTALAAPSKIILGGRVMAVPDLIEKLRVQFRRMLGVEPYPRYEEMMEPNYITTEIAGTPAEPGKPGVLGALVLAAVRSRKLGLDIVAKTLP